MAREAGFIFFGYVGSERDYSGRSEADNIVQGPYYVDAFDVYVSGAVESDVYVSGAVESEVSQ